MTSRSSSDKVALIVAPSEHETSEYMQGDFVYRYSAFGSAVIEALAG